MKPFRADAACGSSMCPSDDPQDVEEPSGVGPTSIAAEPIPTPRGPGRFSRLVTVLAAIFVGACLLFLAFVGLLTPRLAAIPEPERALALVVGNDMALEEAIKRAPAWEQALYDTLSGTNHTEELEQAIDWYEELADYDDSPIALLHLAILEAEAGHEDWLREHVTEWANSDEPLPSFARLVERAYLDPGPVSLAGLPNVEELRQLLLSAWFCDHLTTHLFPRTGQPQLAAVAIQQQQAWSYRAERSLWWNRGWTIGELVLLLIGFIALIRLWSPTPPGRGGTFGTPPGDIPPPAPRPEAVAPMAGWGRRDAVSRLADAPLPPPWPVASGATVLVRGLAGMFAVVGLASVAASLARLPDWLVELLFYPTAAVPLLVLVRRHLLAPADLALGKGFGVTGSALQIRGLCAAVLAGLGIEQIGDWLLGCLGGRLDLPSHWSEWFDPDLAWGPAPAVGANLLTSIVAAPIFEEWLFRGLLYGTLRTRLGPGRSALASAAVFASMHGYGLMGWLSVFWSGMILAWVYERTRSLVPGMMIHGIGNLCSSAGVLLLRVS